MDEYQCQADGQAGKVVGGSVGLGSGTEHHEYEYTGEYQLSHQAAKHRDGLHLVDGLQVVGPRADQAGRRGDDVEDGGTQDAADHLIEHVHATVLAAHASAEIYAERDSGINVAARDSADGVGHCHD